jgi:hypothetical protein
VYEKHKVLNDNITLEFACGLVTENFGIQLNWATYALVAHEKCNYLQTMRQVAKENKIHLQLVLLKQASSVTQDVIKSSLEEILKFMTRKPII